MKKRLNIQNASKAMQDAGLTQTAVAEQLSVSKEAVSQWLKEKSFPRPNKLLQFAKLLQLGFSELVIIEEPNAPVIAFRKKAGTKTKNHHVEKAQETGRFLRHLVPYLPFDTLEMPPILKSPTRDYEYLCQVASKVRKEINLNDIETVDFSHLIRRFSELQAVVVPVLWGTKNRHENAIHVHLPDSKTTWVYLNLDVNIHDFKFWMAHELGHCLSPTLSGNEAEDFADDFAGALLFPNELAEQAYKDINTLSTSAAKIKKVIDIAEKQIISPYTVLEQANKFSSSAGLPKIELSTVFHGAVTNFNKGFVNLSEALLGDTKELDAREFIKKSETSFETPFFDLLRKYLKENNKGAGFVQVVTDMPLLDAQSIHSELT
ncbi:MAG: transcriptional regulator with XRE-family HTH domain [Polaribacter sp.]|jgi:transcriptional regulator with XRE-family HTH domain